MENSRISAIMQDMELNHLRVRWQRLRQKLAQLPEEPSVVAEKSPLTTLGICLLRRRSAPRVASKDSGGPPIVNAAPIKDDKHASGEI
jgi:hypothetical protein